jgi:hypothetical protein
MTSDKKIPIVSTRGIVLFADWEEITSLEDLKTWHTQVYETLNPSKQYNDSVRTDILYSEAVFSENTYVQTLDGSVPLKNIRPGDTVLDADGNPTIVEGIVEVDSCEVYSAISLGPNEYASSAAWFYEHDEWRQSVEKPTYLHNATCWLSLFTTAGTFQIHTANGVKSVRDFTDIGPDHIHETYHWVLESLWKQKQNTK